MRRTLAVAPSGITVWPDKMPFLTLGADMARPSRTGGKASEAKARNESAAKGRKTTKTKRGIAPAATQAKRDPASGPSKDLKEARKQQAATAEILRVIASSPSDVQPVFEAIVVSATRLIAGFTAAVYRFVDGNVHLAALTSVNPVADEAMRASFPRPIADVGHFRIALAGKTFQITDTEQQSSEPLKNIARARGFRSVLHAPLKSNDTSIGMISVTRRDPGSFAAHHVQLLQTFADQAVIAIENARLFNEVQARTRELTESLQQQTATSEVLEVISSSPGELQPVFQRMLENATRVCGARFGVMSLWDGAHFNFAAGYDVPPAFAAARKKTPIPPIGALAKVIETRRFFHIDDVRSSPGYLARAPHTVEMAELAGARTLVIVPMLKENELVGIITIYRQEVKPFTEKQIALVEIFTKQAVIAIENARLLKELRQRTSDLSDALTYQTGSANILKVIASSPTDINPVFQAIVESACELCDAYDAVLRLKSGDNLCFSAHHGPISTFTHERPINRDWSAGRAVIDQKPIQIADLLSPEGNEFPEAREIALRQKHRTVLSVPLLREGECLGAITLRRKEVHPFSDKQITLLQTFADQAVIAIENVRLFDEVQAKTRDLSEALNYQTGSANILKVIASSPTDVGPVLQAIVESACELCEAYDAVVLMKDGDDLRFSAHQGPIAVRLNKFRIGRSSVTGRSVIDGTPVHIHDMLSDEGAEFPEGQEHSRRDGFRSILSIPMLHEGESIGAIALRRIEAQPFTDKQIALLQSFADQAVIAIGNVRLFDEVQARTRDLSESLEQQTGTSEVLKAISALSGELEPVFQAMLENAVHLCGAKFAMLYLYEDNEFRAVGKLNLPPAWEEFLGKNAIRANPRIPMGRVALTHQPVHVEDVLTDPAYIEGYPGMVGVAELGGARTLLQVPMLKDNELVGTIGIYRQEVRPFTDKQIALVQSFAAQAVIAVENTRLLNELRQRTNDLTESLNDLRTAQDRLVQTEKLASLGQLTAGIAHEIKNPLNFVNNFSALSAELTDELNDVLRPVAMDSKVREEVDELTGMLRSNLEKVVQHGNRADSIVKNMLLHSREGSREHRPTDINSLLDESLNLAYHGARAEKGEFNIALQRDFDADAGTIEVFPQEITRAFLNLIANGVYAATKRKTEYKEPAYQPTLLATTKNLGTTVEIRIRDNGTGIPAEVREKMFNPFFTTKPAGEGIGLGLSMTHDIIVKQHGGRIDVATEPGQFTEFTIVLPRKSNLAGGDRGKA
jgi:GAF domain-containing protein